MPRWHCRASEFFGVCVGARMLAGVKQSVALAGTDAPIISPIRFAYGIGSVFGGRSLGHR